MSSLDNYEIVPAVVTKIRHRSECIPYYDAFYSDEQGGWCLSGAYLPIIVAPMASVINDQNYLKFDEQGLMTVMPRTIPLSKRIELLDKLLFVAFGMDEFKAFIAEHDSVPEDTKICLDLAVGNMQEVLDVCKQAKEKFGKNLILMTGNIANPDTYFEYANAGIDYVRCGIGGGSVCSTSYLSGVHYSADHLLNELVKRKKIISLNPDEWKSIPKIVMDGGINSIRQIIIALAMGADYVMCGQIFASCEEACGKVVTLADGRYREYYGMSTERAQKEMGNVKIKNSEGVEKLVPIKYNLKDWVNKFVSVISSTMSYCDKTMLTDFVGNVTVKFSSPNEYKSYEKSQYI